MKYNKKTIYKDNQKDNNKKITIKIQNQKRN